MSLLGKKREKRDEKDEKVRHNKIIFNNLLISKEYNLMFGIKDEEPNEKEENKDILTIDYKKENKDSKIIEMTINLPKKEKIKSKNIKNENKKSLEKEETKKNLFDDVPEENNTNKKNLDEENKGPATNNIFNSKPSVDPIMSSIEKNTEQKKEIKNDDEKKSMSNFGDLINNKENEKNENKPQPTTTLFGNINDNKDDKDKPQVSLFGNTPSLFGTNNNNSLFSTDNKPSLFSNNNTLFSFGNKDNKLLFSNNTTNENNNTPLFSNNNIFSNPFSQIKGESFLKANFNDLTNDDNKKNLGESLFGDNLKDEKPNNDDEDDERDKPKIVYISEPLKAQDYSNYSKIYNAHLNKLFLFNQNEKKFVSKGNGFFSIEKAKEEKDKPHQAVIVFRNQTGNKIVEGLVDKKFDKVEITNKDFNYVVSFGFVMMIEGKPTLGYLRIPFTDEEKAKDLKEAFTKAISFINENK